MEKTNARAQYNFWMDKEDMDWLNAIILKFPFKVSGSELMRQMVKEIRYEQENKTKKSSSLLSYILGEYRS